jgi:hypothetical protein
VSVIAPIQAIAAAGTDASAMAAMIIALIAPAMTTWEWGGLEPKA